MQIQHTVDDKIAFVPRSIGVAVFGRTFRLPGRGDDSQGSVLFGFRASLFSAEDA